MKSKILCNVYSSHKATTFFLIIGLSSILFLTSCTQQTVFTATSTPDIPSVSYIGAGVAIGIRESPDSPAWRTYKVASHSPFTAFVRLLNQKNAETYLFTCLIDYRQTPCSFEDNKKMTILYSINMAENEDRLIKFETSQLPDGSHDFAILVFASPEQHNLDDKFRLSTDLKYFYAARAVLHVGIPPYSPPVMDFEAGEARNYSESKNNGVVINTVPDSRIIPAWFSQNVKQGEIIDYYIHLANDTGPDQTYVVMSFLDFLQISVSKNQENHYVALKPGKELRYRRKSRPRRKMGSMN